jgi:uncharacterized membrane protein YfbV (UPF0208 family)
MKKLPLFILAMVLGTAAFAQKFVPQIKNNSIINYTFTLNGQDAPMVLTFNSLGNPTKIDWNIDGYGSGSYEMSAKALQSGKGFKPAPPDPDVLTKLPDYQTIACISKDAFNDLIKNQTFNYDDLKFSVAKNDTQTIKLNDKELDVIHVAATNGKGEMWILNNPDFPLICKTKDNAQGMDLNLLSIQ